MSEMELNQLQFGQNAEHYVKSVTHRKGASLDRLLELITPQPNWRVLDVAAAIGYTGLAFAPFVATVRLTDITTEMLALARKEADDRGLSNVIVEYAEADALNYPAGSFDLVTCRIAPHHFPDIPAFVAEAVRVLRPGGLLVVVDNVVPDGIGGDYVNAFEKLRDPSHGRCLPLDEWQAHFLAAGLVVDHSETLEKRIPFNFWAKRHNPDTQRYLRTMLLHAPLPAAAYLCPNHLGDDITFRLEEGLIVGRKA